MVNNNDKYIKLANYIYHDLEEEEVHSLEKEFREDPQLSEFHRLNEDVKDYLKARIQLEDMRTDPLLHEAEKLAGLVTNGPSGPVPAGEGIPVERKSERKQGRSLSLYRRIWPLAAAAVAVLVVIRLFLPPLSSDRLFNDYYTAYPATDHTLRAEPSSAGESYSPAIQLYNRGEYEQSLQLLEEQGESILTPGENEFFRGLDYMGLGQFETAAAWLNSVVETPNNYRTDALWYLSLCYLKNGELLKAGNCLEQLELYDGSLREDARSLRKKIDRLK